MRPAAAVRVHGLARPLIGFWGVFFGIVSGLNCTSRQDGGGFGSDSAGGWTSWKGDLSSELVWGALVYAIRLRVLREGWDDGGEEDGVVPSNGGNGDSGHRDSDQQSVPLDAQGVGGAGAGTATAAAAARAARRSRRKETSKALWQCVRLLLAASPFSEEFAVGPAGQISSAVAATAQSTKAAAAAAAAVALSQSLGDRYGSLSPTAAVTTNAPSPVVLAAKESFSSPGMVARVMLERVLVLARIYPAEAGPHGVVEKLWEGAQRVSIALCVLPGSAGSDVGGGMAVDGRTEADGCCPQADERRENSRLRSARRLGQWSTPSQGADVFVSSSGKMNGNDVHTYILHMSEFSLPICTAAVGFVVCTFWPRMGGWRADGDSKGE